MSPTQDYENPFRQEKLNKDAWNAFEAFIYANTLLGGLLYEKREEAIKQGVLTRRLNNSLNAAEHQAREARAELIRAVRAAGGQVDPGLLELDQTARMMGSGQGFTLSVHLRDKDFVEYCRQRRRHAYKDDFSVKRLGTIWQDYCKMVERRQRAAYRRGAPIDGQLSLDFGE